MKPLLCTVAGHSSGAVGVEVETLDPLDAIILPPTVGGAIRTAAEQAVQHGQERRALQREVVLARARKALKPALPFTNPR